MRLRFVLWILGLPAFCLVCGCGLFAGDNGGTDGGDDGGTVIPPELEGFGILAEGINDKFAPQYSMVANAHLYVAGGEGGVRIYDLIDPQRPSLVSKLALDGECNAFDLAYDHLFIAAGTAGVHTVDVSDPTAPALATTCTFGQGDAREIRVLDDTYAFLADNKHGLIALTPTQMPEALYSVSNTLEHDSDLANVTSIDIQGTMLYLTDTMDGVFVAWTRDDNPLVNGLEETVPTEGAYDIVVRDGFGYVANRYLGTNQVGFTVLEFSQFGTYLHELVTPREVYGLDVEGNYAYLAEDRNDLEPALFEIVDVSDPKNPVSAGSVPVAGIGRSAHVEGDLAYVSVDSGGLQVVDVANPAAPAVVHRIYGGDFTSAVQVKGNHALVASRDAGLQVIDVSSPAAARVVGDYQPYQDFYDLAVEGDLAYLAGGILFILDLSNTTSPAFVSRLSRGAQNVAVKDGYVYLSNYLEFGLDITFTVVDARDPAAPQTLNEQNINGIVDLAFVGDYLYVAAKGLLVYDVSDPANPTQVSSLLDGENLEYMAVTGDHVYLKTKGIGLFVIDASDPANPAVDHELRLNIWDVEEVGDYLYTCTNAGFEIFDLKTKPAGGEEWKPLITIKLPGYCHEFVMTGGRVYATAEEAGLVILGKE